MLPLSSQKLTWPLCLGTAVSLGSSSETKTSPTFTSGSWTQFLTGDLCSPQVWTTNRGLLLANLPSPQHFQEDENFISEVVYFPGSEMAIFLLKMPVKTAALQSCRMIPMMGVYIENSPCDSLLRDNKHIPPASSTCQAEKGWTFPSTRGISLNFPESLERGITMPKIQFPVWASIQKF